MQLVVITLNGDERLIDIEPNDRIINLKEKLEEKDGIPPIQQRLIYQGKQLRDDRSIESYRLKPGSILHLVVALRDEIYGIWLKLRYEYLQLTPEIKNLLHKLRQHYLIGLITNGTSCAQWEKINRLKLRNYFDIILVSGDLPWEKPHKKIFHEACKYLDVQPEQCLMIGDKLETDILGGITANLGGTIWVPLNNNHHNHHHNHNNLRPDYIINDVIELLDLLPDKSKKLQQYSMLDFDDGSSNSSDGS